MDVEIFGEYKGLRRVQYQQVYSASFVNFSKKKAVLGQISDNWQLLFGANRVGYHVSPPLAPPLISKSAFDVVKL